MVRTIDSARQSATAFLDWTTLPSEGVARNSENPRSRRNDLALLFSPDLPLVRPGTITETEQNDAKQKVSRSGRVLDDTESIVTKRDPLVLSNLAPLVSRIGPPFCIYRARRFACALFRTEMTPFCNIIACALPATESTRLEISFISRRGQILEPRLASGVDWNRDLTREGFACYRGRDGWFLGHIFSSFFHFFFDYRTYL